MQLLIAGEDRSRDLGPAIARGAPQTRAARRYAPADSALSLKAAKDEADFAERFCRLVWMRHSLRTDDFPIPSRPGWRGRVMAGIKRVLWKLLRYQHDRIAFQQNLLNELLIAALELQRRLVERRAAEMLDCLAGFERELRELKARASAGSGARP